MTEVSEIVSRFGGPKKLAGELGIPASTVANWPSLGGVPGKWHLKVLRLARERGVALTDDELLNTRRGNSDPDTEKPPMALAATEA
ncbi:MAG: carph-isopro domain-containing protein [Hyphomicrobiaceae bacterium]